MYFVCVCLVILLTCHCSTAISYQLLITAHDVDTDPNHIVGSLQSLLKKEAKLITVEVVEVQLENAAFQAPGGFFCAISPSH